jgi:hypothetical protein
MSKGGGTSRGGDRIGEALRRGQAEKWATPNACERGPESRESKDRRGAGGIDLMTQAASWATPTAGGRTSLAAKPSKERLAGGGCSDLRVQVQAWATATVGDSKQTASSADAKARGFDMTLSEAGKSWPSPRAEDSESCGNHPGATDSLTGATRGWARPAARDEKGANGLAHLSKDRPHEDQLANQAVHSFAHSAHQGATTTADGLDSLLLVWTRPSSPRLSPAFQWWLMRWPHPRAIYSASAATEWTRWWSQMRSCVRGIDLEVERE